MNDDSGNESELHFGSAQLRWVLYPVGFPLSFLNSTSRITSQYAEI
jgi:hypothetical protein